MKKALYILLIFLPTLLISQYHDAQWIWADYKMDFRRNNDSVVVHTGRMQISLYNKGGAIDSIGLNHLLNYNFQNGDRFLFITEDSTWINNTVLSTRYDTDYYYFRSPRITGINGFLSNEFGDRLFTGFKKINNDTVRMYRKYIGRDFKRRILIYDDIDLDRNKKEIYHDYKFGIDSVSDFVIMPHTNPDKHWIIGHIAQIAELNSYIVENGVIDTIPKKSFNLKENGLEYNKNTSNISGIFHFKPSPSGNMLLAHNWAGNVINEPVVYLFTFDNETGQLEFKTEFGDILDKTGLNYDVLFNFSPNSRYFYLQKKKKLFQYDLSDLDSLSIHNAKKVVAELDTNLSIWKMNGNYATNILIGINGKMYYRNPLRRDGNPRPGYYYQDFSIIHRPDKPGVQADLKINELTFDFKATFDKGWGREDVYWNRSQYPSHMIGRTVSYCEGEDAYLNNVWRDEFVGTNFKWELLNLESDDEDLAAEINKYFEENEGIDEPFFPNATHNYEGKYYITWTDTLGYNRERIVNLYVDTLPKVNIVSTKLTADCERERYRLQPETIVERYDYRWSTGETTPVIEVDSAGEYKLYVTSFQGCVDSSSINIVFDDEELYLEILGGDKLCQGSTITLSANQEYESYLWNTDETTKSIEIDDAGQYILTIETSKGCLISDTVDITYHPNVIAELKPAPTTICEGDSVLLESKYDADYFDYLWSTNEITKSIYASETGTYKLKITDTRTGCMDSTEIAISVEDNLQPTIIGTNICESETATLEVIPNDPSYSYEWSNGETTPTIVVSQPATYTVTVSKDGCSGTAEFTVNESPNPEFEILGEDIVCGNSATLASDQDFAEYLWSTDEITKEIEVTEPGTYTLTVTDENGCSATEEFTVNEQSLSFDISKDRIDFGKVYISETAIDSATIINRSGIELTITDGTQNYIIPDGFPVEYTKTLELTELGPYTDSFEYRVIEPCDTVITIPVTAEVYAKVEISTKEETETKIGAKVSIPVYLQAEADLSEQTYTITTDIDKTVLFTEDEFTITQTAPIYKAKTKVHEISGMIMLASELEYDITFPNYEFNNQYIEVIERPGKILIDSICAFPLRNVTFLESTEMKVSPNPARDRLVVDIFIDIPSDIELVEMEDENKASRFDRLSDQHGQQMQLELISAEGRIAYTENWTQTSSEEQISINTDKIPSGLYQVRLQTPSGVLTENVIVVR